MPFRKGQKPPLGAGRKKGISKNKIPTALKDMILQALANKGGTAYLEAQADKNPQAFMGLIGRVLPLQVKDGGADPMVPTTIVHEYRDTSK